MKKIIIRFKEEALYYDKYVKMIQKEPFIICNDKIEILQIDTETGEIIKY